MCCVGNVYSVVLVVTRVRRMALGLDPTTASDNTSVEKIYKATKSVLKNKKNISTKNTLAYYSVVSM
jgi:hypothetical protein